ncbi:uncharacterized protein [Argopecten irradians]|uniref:uncharacterized protein n=1 Tax=Argopecten irradians TaxID=31199 RepID=UPI00372294EA
MLPRPPVFVPGKLLPDQLQAMIGNLQSGIWQNEDIGYEMMEIDNQMVQTVSFKLSLDRPINAICPIDDTNSWMIFHECNDLIKISKEGKIMETVQLAFKPRCLALTKATEVLLTCHGSSSSIYKLSRDRQVSRFADVSPFRAWGISVCESGEVLVSTLSPKVLVLDNAGNMIRQITCEGDAQNIACLTSGSIAVINSYDTELMVIDSFYQITRTWSGELDNGQKIKKTNQCTIASDRYDRVFVPDYSTNQVYVLAEDERKAKRFLG